MFHYYVAYFPVNVLEGETNLGYMKPTMAYTFLEGLTIKP